MQFILLTLLSVIVTLIVVHTTPTINKVSLKNILTRCLVSWMIGLGVFHCIKQIGGF